MSNEKLIDSFELPSNIKWQLDEYAQEKVVDGKYILGRVIGPMFAPGGDSLNGRHYSKRLWEIAIQRNKERLDHGDVLGCMGHDQVIDDNAMAEGKISHKVTRMWIDEKTGAGMGEIQILGTESGKALNALLRGGVRLQVSTRATGQLSDRKATSGNPIIDEDTYKFEGIDFVRKGGIPSATPILVEKHYEIPQQSQETPVENTPVNNNNHSPIKDKNRMSETLLESLAIEKSELKKALEEALGHNQKLTAERDALRLEAANRQNEVNRISETFEDTKKKLTVLEDKLAESEIKVKSYVALGESDKISEEINAMKILLAEYNEFGTVAQLTDAYAKVEELVEEYKPLGSPSRITKVLEEAAPFLELGTAEELKEKLDTLTKYEESGTLEEVDLLISTLEAYKPLGTPEDIAIAFQSTDNVFSKLKAEKIKNEAVEIAKKYRVKADRVEEMLIKNGKELTVSLLEDLTDISDNTITDRYSVTNNNKTEVTVENVEENQPKSRADLILERFSRVAMTSPKNFNPYE